MIAASRRITGSVWMAMLLALSACGTPQNIRTLSAKTSDNVISVAVDLDRLTHKSRQAAERRAQSIARLAAVLAETRVALDQEIALAEKAGLTDVVSLYGEIKALGAEWARRWAEIKQTAETTKAEILSEQVRLETAAAGMRDVGGQLLELSKDDRGLARIEFIAGFAQDVASEIQEAQESADEASTNASSDPSSEADAGASTGAAETGSGGS